MERLEFSLHFSYLVVLACALLLSNVVLFLMCSIAMLVHELAHYFVAKKLYYNCTKLQLSAFGAVLYGEFDTASARHQIIIAIAGPLANILVVIMCVALWWTNPETYYYTEPLVNSNLAMALINLLPVYPLDGGRVLWGLTNNRASSVRWLKCATLIVSLVLFAASMFSMLTDYPLYGLGIFSVFLCASYCVDGNEQHYKRVDMTKVVCGRIVFGMEKKVLVYHSSATLSRVLVKLGGNYVYDIEVYCDDGTITLIDNRWLSRLLVKCEINTTLADVVHGNLYRHDS